MFSVQPFLSRMTAGYLNIQAAHFSKYISKSRTKRLPLTTKRVGRGYYKGHRSRKEGKINSKGIFPPMYCNNNLLKCIVVR